ncbi:MAG: hypothetical protein VXZ35_08905 [Pseudomonadota bacterium]|nr:hypothetical protein [Pseudomonadota bacterium]
MKAESQLKQALEEKSASEKKAREFEEKARDAQDRVMLETKERLKAEDKVRKEEEAKAAVVADADTAMEAR